MSTANAPTIARRHDLDALRAFAMLLGIALHAGLSFTPFPWVVQDSRQNESFALFFAAVHGFRMPLFFLVSGFFTAMLWRKRGLQALIKHRAKRILLPCVLGLFTIVPLMALVSVIAISVASGGGAETGGDDVNSLCASVKFGDLAAVQRQLTEGTDPNLADPEFQMPPLIWAAMHGQPEAAELLIDGGADVNGHESRNSTALHLAALTGHADVAGLLVERGIDVDVRNADGATALDCTKADWGTTQFFAGLLQVSLPDQDEVMAGRARIRDLINGADSIDTPHEDKQGFATAHPEDDNQQSAGVLAAYQAFLFSDQLRLGDSLHLIQTPVFHHLWFLWFLCWMIPFFAVYTLIAERVGLVHLPKWLILSPARLLWLLPLTLVPQLFMGLAMPTFGPDTSVGILPQPHLLLYYGIFFAFGVVYFDCDDQDGRLGGWWWLSIPVAVVGALPLGLATMADDRFVTAGAQVVYAWAMTFGLIGVFRRLMTSENKTIRYMSDASYWLYLTHLPLVIGLQAVVRSWSMPAIVKFSIVCVASTAWLLFLYQTLVRYTWLGTLLNGPRTRPAAKTPTETEPIVAEASA